MRLRPAIFGVLVGAAAIGYVVWHQYPFFRGLFLDLSPETAATLRPGMTIDEISVIVGGPPGEYHLRANRDRLRFIAVSVGCGGGSESWCPPQNVVWQNQFRGVIAHCGSIFRPTSTALHIRYFHTTPSFYYLYRDIAHALGVAIVVLVGWYTALGPLVRRVRSA
jgi:hypothetical protein